MMNDKFYTGLAPIWAAMVKAQELTPSWCKAMLEVANQLALDLTAEFADPEPQPEPTQTNDTNTLKAMKPKPAGRPAKRLRIDWGKVGACYKAGWSAEKIADEVGASVVTIRNGIYAKKWEDAGHD